MAFVADVKFIICNQKRSILEMFISKDWLQKNKKVNKSVLNNTMLFSF